MSSSEQSSGRLVRFITFRRCHRVPRLEQTSISCAFHFTSEFSDSTIEELCLRSGSHPPKTAEGRAPQLDREARDSFSHPTQRSVRSTRKSPPFRKERERIDWIRAKARFELSMLLVRTKTAGQKGAFAHDDYRM